MSQIEYKIKSWAITDPWTTRGGIRCLGGISIPCWPVTPPWAHCLDQINRVIRSQITFSVCKTAEQLLWNTSGSIWPNGRPYTGKLNRYNDHRILRNAAFKLDCWNPYNKYLFASSLPRFKNRSYAEQALAYRINWATFTQYAGDDGILLKGSWRWRSWNRPVCHNFDAASIELITSPNTYIQLCECMSIEHFIVLTYEWTKYRRDIQQTNKQSINLCIFWLFMRCLIVGICVPALCITPHNFYPLISININSVSMFITGSIKCR